MIVRDVETSGGERAKILDFGLAKIIEPEGGEGITNTGTILGTPAYMAPEQCKSARAADPKSDVYSLGVILYEMLSGDIPFDADTDAELLSKHMFSEPPPLLAKVPEVSTPLAALVHRMLGKDTESRPTADEVATELSQMMAAASLSTSSVGAVAAPVGDGSSRANVVGMQPKVVDNQLALPAKPPETPRRRHGIWWFFVALFFLGTGAAVFWQAKGRQLLGSLGQPAKVVWSLATIPAEVDVLDELGSLVGQTPLSLERPRGVGTVRFTLRKNGYVQKTVDLPLSLDTAITDTLAPLPTPDPPQNTPTDLEPTNQPTPEPPIPHVF